MENALFALPIQSGKTDTARAFLQQQLEGERRSQYAASEKRLGITKEVWAIQESPMGALFVVFFHAPDIGGALRQFVGSQDGSPTLAWGSGGTSCSLVLSALFFVGSYKVWPRRMMTAAMQWART
jgi:hypothetical protein